MKRIEKIVSLRMKILLAAAFAAAVFVCGGCKRAVSEDTVWVETGDESQPVTEETEVSSEETEPETKAAVYVHVCGQVKEPGVYSLQEGSRLYEAIERAGGVTEEGVCDALNLAAVLEDGMRIVVPDKAQAEQWMSTGKGLTDSLSVSSGGAADPKGAEKVNLNRASIQELMTLSGIGQSRAEAIVRYREEIGSFQAIEDVMKVSGIKESAFNKIKDNITV